MTTPTERIRALNDQLRTTGQGGDVVVTRGIAALDLLAKAAIFAAIQAFDRFTTDNDPHGEHDFGTIELEGETYFFKIDYYSLDMQGGSEDSADPEKTVRVMTIMCAAEY